jgi:hypothetical protein
MKKSKQQKLFKPDAILTRIASALRRDLDGLKHVYNPPTTQLEFAVKRQAEEFEKKYLFSDTDASRLEIEAFEKFERINSHMNGFSPFSVKSSRVQSDTPVHERHLMRMKALMYFVLGEFSMDEFFDECKHSSGSTLGCPFSNTSLEAKNRYPLSATSRVVPLFEYYLEYDPLFAEALEEFNKDRISQRYTIVEGSRATTVEKDSKKRRFICVEPTVNMFFQQGLMRVIYRRMKAVGLDVELLPEQHKNRARMASITRAESTIDWSSASDCVGIELLRYLLPPEWFYMVWTLRCDFTTILGRLVPLHMISTMGNAVTFPLETLVFWTAGHAVRLNRLGSNTLFPEWKDLKRVSVFGDDCIVSTEDTHDFIELCESIGFIVNEEKSFSGENPFRESCGGDYHQGYDVRPYNVRSPHNLRLSSLEPWLYIVANRLLKKYIQYFGPRNYVYDKALWSEILRLFQENRLKLKLVPSDFPDDSGLKLSGDHERFTREYPFELSRVLKGDHCTYIFLFVKFNYKEKHARHDFLRYANWLKHPPGGVSDPQLYLPVRRKGGYVVAKGISTHL